MTTPQHPSFRIFILGAGFSRTAGIQVATELYLGVKVPIEGQHGAETKFECDVGEYVKYCDDCELSDTLLYWICLTFYGPIHHRGKEWLATWPLDGGLATLQPLIADEELRAPTLGLTPHVLSDDAQVA